MKLNKYIFTLLLAILYTSGSFSGFTQTKLPKRLAKESKDFIENQIIPEEKAFLDELAGALSGLSKINQETLEIVNATFPQGKKQYKKITKNIEHTAEKANDRTLGPGKPFGVLNSFIQRLMPAAGEPKETLQGLILDFKTSQEIRAAIGDDLRNTLYAEGAYHYYQLCAESFENIGGENFQEALRRNITFYDHLSELAKTHNITDLKNLTPAYAKRIENTQTLLATAIIDKIHLSNRSWAKQVILNALTMLDKQFQLNKTFNLDLAKSLENIPTPKPARLPNLTVASIELVLPPKVKIGTIIKVIAEIKNQGDLASDRSRALIIFPNGSKKSRPVPKLEPQQSIKIAWRYKVRRSGDHDFNVIANYNQKAWEANSEDNTTIRTLIVPRCLPR